MTHLAMRQALIEALKRAEPHYVCPLPLGDAISEESLLTALLNRDLITEGLDPVLTPAGIEEAEWFSRHAMN
jgi:hypothetical protein